MLCYILAPKSHSSIPEGLCPQLALIDNKELPYSQWLDKKTEARLLDCMGKGLGDTQRITMMGKQKDET